MNSGRSALLNNVATAIAILVVVFGLAAALGGLRTAALIPIFDSTLIGEIAARLPATLEMILISFFIATPLGFVLALPSASAVRVAVAVIVTGLQSLPVLALAIVGMFALPRLLRGTIGICPTPCSFGHQLAFLVVPVVILTIYQLSFLVKYFEARRARAQDVGVPETSTIPGLAMLFAERLPSLVSAAMICEFVYGSRWLGTPDTFYRRDASSLALFLIFNALAVLVIRCIIEFFVERRRIVRDAGG